MKHFGYFLLSLPLILASCKQPADTGSEYAAVSRVEHGTPVAVMLTCYNTTLIADGKDRARLRIAVTDSLSREITSAADTIRLYITGNGRLVSEEGSEIGRAHV